MPVRLQTPDDCDRILETLQSSSPSSMDELFDILSAASETTQALIVRLTIIEQALEDRPFIDRALEAGGWVLGMSGFAFGCADYFEGGHELSFWGWAGLLTGPIALTMSAWAWQRRELTEGELTDERDEIFRMGQLLTEINIEANRRLALV
jgi:hypothetical protein